MRSRRRGGAGQRFIGKCPLSVTGFARDTSPPFSWGRGKRKTCADIVASLFAVTAYYGPKNRGKAIGHDRPSFDQ